MAQSAVMPTTPISDALDCLTIKGGCEGIRPLPFGMKMCGPAFTVRYIPVKFGAAGVGDYIDDAQTGDVIVIDNAGRPTARCGEICSPWWWFGANWVARSSMGFAGM